MYLVEHGTIRPSKYEQNTSERGINPKLLAQFSIIFNEETRVWFQRLITDTLISF